MGVGIRYTGINGKTTAFSSESAVSAIERLSSVPGYSITPTESLVGNMAKSKVGKKTPFEWKAQPILTNGMKRTTVLTDIKMKDGKIVKVTENGFRSADGSFIPYGGRSEMPIENIGGN